MIGTKENHVNYKSQSSLIRSSKEETKTQDIINPSKTNHDYHHNNRLKNQNPTNNTLTK